MSTESEDKRRAVVNDVVEICAQACELVGKVDTVTDGERNVVKICAQTIRKLKKPEDS